MDKSIYMNNLRFILLTVALIIFFTIIGFSQTTAETTKINTLINEGVSEYQKNNFVGAFQKFEASLKLSEKYYIDTIIIFNAAVSADKSGKITEALYFYRKCLTYNYGAENIYSFIANLEKKRGNTDGVINVLQEGYTKYSKSNTLLFSIINYYIETEQANEAIFYLDKAIEKEPKNATLYFAKGSLFDMSFKDFDNAKYYYEKAIQVNPSYLDAFYNLGALFFNRGVELNTEANNVPVSEQKRYEVAMEFATEEFKKALPYLEKAHLINPNDKTIIETLKTLYFKLQKENLSYKSCYDEIAKKLKGEHNYYTPFNPYNPATAFQNVKKHNPISKPIPQNKPTPIKNNEKTNQQLNPDKIERLNSIDDNIPTTNLNNENSFALIIGNEQYANEIKVNHAINDATVFSKYVVNTLGVPESNVKVLTNATLGEIYTQVKWIADVVKSYRGTASVIFYYAGHGMPDETTKDAYLLPIDGISEMPLTAIKLDWLYNELTLYPSQQVTVLLDACFSGGARDGMLAKGRGVRVRPKNSHLKKNIIVFSATNESQTAYPYEDKKHGLFTYFLLKKLNETKGNVSLGELHSYVSQNVEKKAIVVNSKPQTPTVMTSPDFMKTWKNKRLVK